MFLKFGRPAGRHVPCGAELSNPPAASDCPDPIAPGAPGGVEQTVDDLVSVLDAVGSERAALFAVGGSGITSLVAAATHPEHVGSIVLVNCYARMPWADDYQCIKLTEVVYIGDLLVRGNPDGRTRAAEKDPSSPGLVGH